jgi:hypothetical protein
MIEFLEAPDDTVAMRFSGRIASADLDAAMDQLVWCMGVFQTVNLFIETRAVAGFELAGWPHRFARSLPLLANLDRFGRVAVVADQAWVRAGTRLESALLPFIAYRAFRPERRDEAFAWACGTQDARLAA